MQQVVDVMDEYSLNQEDVDTILELSKFKVRCPFLSLWEVDLPCQTKTKSQPAGVSQQGLPYHNYKPYMCVMYDQ